MIAYTIVPTNGNTEASVAQPTSIGSSIRRLASVKVQKISATQTTSSTRIRTLTAVLTLSLLMPKTPRVSMRSATAYPEGLQEHAAEEIAEREEDEDNERHDHGDEHHHLQYAGAAGVHSADALLRPGSDSRSAT